ncbi:hypothetical protein PHAVU_009G129001 [Phaseolus vulgaris]
MKKLRNCDTCIFFSSQQPRPYLQTLSSKHSPPVPSPSNTPLHSSQIFLLQRTLQVHPFLLYPTTLLTRRNGVYHLKTKATQSQTDTQHRQPQTKISTSSTQSKKLDKIPKNYEAIIGIETHVQLSTLTKAFCGFP